MVACAAWRALRAAGDALRPASAGIRGAAREILRILRSAGRALRDFVRGFTGLATAPAAEDASGRRALEEQAGRRPRCC